MNCNRCLFKYDQVKHIPKLLIMCGHTLCEKCCFDLIKGSKIECYQCKTQTIIDKVTNLPKNLALIAQKNTDFKCCSKHSKKYQAFCSNEKSLICIQCILQDGHKNHEMNSITKAFEIQSNSFKNKIQKIEAYLKSVQEKAQQNLINQNQFNKNFRQVNDTVKQVFNLIRQLINQQQVSILKEMEIFFVSHDQKLNERNQTYNLRICEITEVLSQASQFQRNSEINFLDTIKYQDEHLNLIKFISYENPKNFFSPHTKQSILQTCIKVLTSEKTPVKNVNFSSNQSQMEKHPPKTQKTPFIEPMRGFRKAAFSNMTNCQNINSNKSQKRVSARKQSISHQVQAPITKTIDKVLKPTNMIRPLSSCENSNEKKTIKKIDIVECVNSDISSVDPRESLCNSFMSNMTSFMAQSRSIYIIGGFNEENNNVMKLDLGTMNYQEVATMNANRSKFGAVFVDKKLFVFGGKRGKQRLNDIEAFDFQRNTWTKVGTMNKSRSGFGITIVENEIYLIGGNDGENILNTVETFNIETKEWRKIQSMNEARDQLAIAVGNNQKIYAIGGFGGENNQPLKSVEVLDLRTKQWSQIKKMKYPRRALSAAILADGIYAIGGFDGASYMSSVQKYDYTTNQWTEVSQMNIARCTHSSIASYETQQIYVFGGFDFLPLSSVQKYSLITNEWQKINDMPSSRFMHSSTLGKICF